MLSQLQHNWDPLIDSRLTVWEVTHYLLRALLQDESSASELLRKIGPGMGERARTLAYQMFSLADKRGSADEASDYNMLVTAWPELEKLAQQNKNTNTSTDSLF
jgi:putative DNA methylase